MKLRRKLTALILALVMVFSLTVSASAATAQQVTVKLSPNITVTLDGEAQAMTDVNGNPVYPVLYGGTTYLPVRAVGNMLGLGVDWDQATQTVLLTDSGSKNTATSGTMPSGGAPSGITVSINPGITVKYNGEAQEMKDTNGNPVYPMLYGGTTYLPVRAVSNMLMVDVGWDQATQTVVLDNSLGTLTVDENGDAIVEGSGYAQLYRTMKSFGISQEIIDLNLRGIENVEADGISVNLGSQYRIEPLKTLGNNHIGYEWVELDYSTADEGYIRIKINDQVARGTACTLRWYDENNKRHSFRWDYLPTGQWDNIPLLGGSADYTIEVSQSFSKKEYALPWDEFEKLYRPQLNAEFSAEFDEAALWLMSTAKIDYENAPNTCAKAEELTKNCTTDTEKITAIFNYVVTTIRYDSSLFNEIEAYNNKINTDKDFDELFKNGTREYLALDDILSSRSGVCEDYAILMAGMLRSIGVPCKFVGGMSYANSAKGTPHAWVAVKPETGSLDLSTLGAGKDYASYTFDKNNNVVPADPTGWIRLDPTFASTGGAEGRAAAANDNNYRTSEYY